MAGKHLHVARERGQSGQRVEEILRTLARRNREIRTRRVADEQRVPGQDERVVDEKGAVLGAMAGRVQDRDRHPADPELLAVDQRLVRELDLREGMDGNRCAVLEGEPAVTRDMVGVRVRLEHTLDPDTLVRGCLQHGLDLERRVDDDGDSGRRVTDEVAGAAEILVHELPKEQHEG